jgi:hypothetical protein
VFGSKVTPHVQKRLIADRRAATTCSTTCYQRISELFALLRHEASLTLVLSHGFPFAAASTAAGFGGAIEDYSDAVEHHADRGSV